MHHLDGQNQGVESRLACEARKISPSNQMTRAKSADGFSKKNILHSRFDIVQRCTNSLANSNSNFNPLLNSRGGNDGGQNTWGKRIIFYGRNNNWK